MITHGRGDTDSHMLDIVSAHMHTAAVLEPGEELCLQLDREVHVSLGWTG